jgi:chromosome segregation ATPase
LEVSLATATSRYDDRFFGAVRVSDLDHSNDRLSNALEATKTSLSEMEAQASRMQAHEETWALQRDGMDKRLHEYEVQCVPPSAASAYHVLRQCRLTTIIEQRDTAVSNSNTLNSQLVQLSQQLDFTRKQAQECENAMRYAQAENKTMADRSVLTLHDVRRAWMVTTIRRSVHQAKVKDPN